MARVFIKGGMRSAGVKLGWLTLLLLLLVPGAAARQQPQEEEDDIKPSRPTVANSAEIQKAGVLQVEFGYDSNLPGDEFRSQHSLPLTLRFAASDRLLLEADLDAVKSETDEAGTRMTGVGDARLGFQLVALKEAVGRPALGFAYYVKLPSASEEKGLGTGRFDHALVGLLSKKFGQTDMDLNVAYLNVGREESGRRASGGQAAVAFSREFENDFGVVGELSGQSLDDVQPRGVYALGALTYKVSGRLRLDAGARFGLNPEAPRFGLFAGMSVGVTKPFHR